MKLPFYETWEVTLPIAPEILKSLIESRIRPAPFSGAFTHGWKKNRVYGTISNKGFKFFWFSMRNNVLVQPLFQGFFTPVSSGTIVRIRLRPCWASSVFLLYLFVFSIAVFVSENIPVPALLFLWLTIWFYVEAGKGRKKLASFFDKLARLDQVSEKSVIEGMKQ